MPTQSSSLFSNSKDNVKVVIRVRPLNEREKSNGGNKKCVTVENDTIIGIDGYKSFNFDYVADEDVYQNVIFEQIARPIADCCLQGYNGTIFAYGQTGSGKTFTIQGPNTQNAITGEETIFGSSSHKKSGAISAENARGIMQRSFEYVFECLEEEIARAEQSLGESYQFEYLIRCSYLEIYNEQIMDLLEPSSVNLHIREDIKKGVYVEGLQEEVVLSAEDMISIIQTGAKNRHVGSHAMNKESSRSHSVLTTIIETKSMKEGGGVWNIKTSRFHIIDLAGSERSKQTNAVGERLKEAGMINKSLSALGNVINSLVDISEGKSRHVHYRDSKLTFLLRDSLGGNSKTLIIANVSPSTSCHGETLSTLKFAQRAKLIKNKAVINEDSSGTIQLLKAEISRLKKDLAESEKVMKSLQDSNIAGEVSECTRCKAIFEQMESDDGSKPEDEMLVSFDENNQKGGDTFRRKVVSLQKNEIATLRSRVIHLESLLSANLDSLSTQQKYFENELAKAHHQNKRLQQTIETYEKQSARDKMIIKFREERLSKLEQGSGSAEGDQLIADLRKEVGLWKEASEHNTQAAKLFAEKSELQNRLDKVHKEVEKSPESLSHQVRGLTEMNESLNQYLKTYCEESRKELEKELASVKIELAETIDIYNVKMQHLQQAEKTRKEKYLNAEQAYKQKIDQYIHEIQQNEARFSQEKEELVNRNCEETSLLQGQIQNLMHSSEAQVLQLNQKLKEQEDLAVNTKSTLEQALSEVSKRFTDLHSEYQTLIASSTQKFDSERQAHEDVLRVVEERWNQRLIEVVSEKERELSAELELREQVNEELKREIKTMEQTIQLMGEDSKSQEQLVQNLRNKLKQSELGSHDLQTRLQKLTSDHATLQKELSASQSSLSESRTRISNIEAELITSKESQVTLRRESEQQMQAAMEAKQKEIEIIMEEYVKEMDRVRAEMEHKIKNQQDDILNSKTSMLAALQDAQIKTQQEILRVQSEKDLAVEEVRQEYQSQIDAQKNAKEQEIVRMQETFTKEVEEIKRAKETENQRLEARIEELGILIYSNESQKDSIIQEKDLALISLQKDSEKQKQLLQSTIENNLAQISTLTTQVSSLQSALDLSYQDKEQALARIREEQSKAISLIEAHVERMQDAQIEREAQIEEEREEAFREKIVELSQRFERQIQELTCEKEEMRIRMEKTREQTNGQMEVQLNTIKALNESLQEKVKELQHQIQSKQQEHAQHMSKVSQAMTDTQAKLNHYHLETSRLATQLDQQLSQNDQLLSELSAKQHEIHALTHKCEKLASEKKELSKRKDDEIAKLNELMGVAKLESEKAKRDYKEIIDSEVQSKEEERKKYDLEIAEIRHKLTSQTAMQELENAHQVAIQTMRAEINAKDSQINEFNNQQAKSRRRIQELEEVVKQYKETISMTLNKETELQSELKSRLQDYTAREEKLRKHLADSHLDRDRLKRDVESLKDLVSLKDKQLDDILTQDQRDKHALQSLTKDNKDLLAKLQKQKLEMNELVLTFKFLSDQKKKVDLELEKLQEENRQLIGHKNPSQKIQHHLKIKEENNRLREENMKLQEELRRKVEIMAASSSGQEITIHKNQDASTTTAMLIDHLFNQPSLTRALGITNEQIDSLLQNQQASNSGCANIKVKKAMEMLSTLNECFNVREARMRELEHEVKQNEAKLIISEKERQMVQQQQREMIQSPLINAQMISQISLQAIKPQNNKENVQQVHVTLHPQKQRGGAPSIDDQTKKAFQPPQSAVDPQSRMNLQHQQLLLMQSKQDRDPTTSTTQVGVIKQLVSRGGSTKRLVSGAAAAFLSANPSSSHLVYQQQQPQQK